MSPHDVALAIDLAGEMPRVVRSTGRRYSQGKLDEAAFFQLEFPRGVLARIHVSWLSSRRVRRVEAYAEKGSIFYDDVEPFEKVRIVSQGEDTRVGAKAGESKNLYYNAGDIQIPALPPAEPLKLECADFLSAIQKRRQPLSGPKMGLQVVQVLEAASRSAKTGGRPVRLS
jgi:predicted dehydrogenase